MPAMLGMQAGRASISSERGIQYTYCISARACCRSHRVCCCRGWVQQCLRMKRGMRSGAHTHSHRGCRSFMHKCCAAPPRPEPRSLTRRQRGFFSDEGRPLVQFVHSKREREQQSGSEEHQSNLAQRSKT